MAQVSLTVRNVHRIIGHKSSYHIKITAVLEGHARFEVAVKVDVKPCSLVDRYRRFGRIFRHYFYPVVGNDLLGYTT
jgi:hypothetical protein